MAGTITHEWTGTVLTITSDSGTSSCDLRGQRGDDGIRGAQGIPGQAQDLTNYPTKQELEEALSNVEVDLSGYATTEYVDTQNTQLYNQVESEIDETIEELPTTYAQKTWVTEQIEAAKLSGEEIDLSVYAKTADITANYYTKTQTNSAIAAAKPDLSNYALKTQIPDVSSYQTAAQVQTLINNSLSEYSKNGHTHSQYYQTSKIKYSSSTPSGVSGDIWFKPKS